MSKSKRKKRPSYNHSREDSELMPCPKCAATDAERELAEALAQAREDILTLCCVLIPRLPPSYGSFDIDDARRLVSRLNEQPIDGGDFMQRWLRP